MIAKPSLHKPLPNASEAWKIQLDEDATLSPTIFLCIVESEGDKFKVAYTLRNGEPLEPGAGYSQSISLQVSESESIQLDDYLRKLNILRGQAKEFTSPTDGAHLLDDFVPQKGFA